MATTVFPNYLTTASVSDKADKVSSATSGHVAGLDGNGNLTDTGHALSEYATKVSSATSGNFASLDENGNLTDSGHKHSDYLTSSTNFVKKNANGQTINGGSVTELELACSTSGNTAKATADSDGGRVRIKKGTPYADFDSRNLVGNGTGYAQITVFNGTMNRNFKFKEDGSFLDGSNVSIGTLNNNKADRSSIAIVESGNTASQNIAKGKFILWKGDPCVASAAIASGDTLSTSTNLTAVSEGFANLLHKAFVTEEYTYSYNGLADGGYLAVSASDLDISEKAGYTLAGCVGYATGSYNIYAYGVVPKTSGTVLSLRNISGASVTTTVTCRVTYLWIKSELM